ncbi:MAG: aspartate aminotransferase family protein [Chloroflexia bacterium]
MKRDHTRLMQALAEAYARYSPRSAALQERAQRVMVDGGSHNVRLIWPFSPRITSARGAWLRDEDGHNILDLWQGHFANVLGHNPEVVTTALAEALRSGWGLLGGMTDVLQIEVAEILCRQTGSERVRFTTSGSLATMYAILLARAFTGRSLVLKVGGGWHGAQPWGLKGVEFRQGYEQPDSEGLSPAQMADVCVTRFNDVEALRRAFRELGDRLACFIVEPFIGAGGFLPARREYLQEARRLTEHYGAVLIFDEIISGFRFRAGDAGALYGIRPDLATFGKAMGGGMPVAAVAGRADILELAGRESSRVRFSGGTYSAHPASMLAAKVMMAHLVEHEAEIYPRLAELGEKARRTMEAAFAEEGIYARCSGHRADVLPGSSLVKLHFPYREDTPLESPDEAHNPDICDDVLAEKALRLALLLEDVHTVHGGGALSTAHNEEDIAFLGEACRRAARRIKPYL